MKSKRKKLIEVLISILYGLTVGPGIILFFISIYFGMNSIILSFIFLSLAAPIIIITLNYSESPFKSHLLELKYGKISWIAINVTILSCVPLIWGIFLCIVDLDKYLTIFYMMALPTYVSMIIFMISDIKSRKQKINQENE